MIYATAYKMSDIRHPGQSVDSGFTCLSDVVDMLGTDYIRQTPRYIIYGDGENRVVYSDFPFRLEAVIRIDESHDNE